MEQTARSFLRAGLAGFALIATTAPAFAQDWSLRAFDKSEAILGGPSSLAAIIAAQSGGTALAASLPLTNAVLRPAPLFAPAPFTPQVEAASDTVAALDRPDVFNSIAMPIDRTPLDKNWSRVGSASVSGRAARFAAALRGRDEQT